MYYINKEGEYRLAQKVKTFAQFYRSRRPVEGSVWGVRKRAKIENWDAIDEYIVRGGKLVKTGSSHIMMCADR